MGKRLSLLKRKVLSASRGGGICQLCYHKILSRVLTNRQMMEAEKDIDKSYRQRMGWLSRMRAIKEGTYKY